MKKWSPYVKCLGFLAGLAVLFSACDYLMAPSGYIRYILHQVHDTENYDTLVLGASHTRAAINPQYLVDTMGVDAINEAIPGETVKDSYYLLEDACESNQIKTVILDVDYQYWIQGMGGSGQIWETFIYNQMGCSKVKAQYVMENLGTMDIRTVFTKRSSYTTSLSGIKNNIATKNSEAYKSYSIDGAKIADANGPYVGRGYFYRLLNGKEPSGKGYLKNYIDAGKGPLSTKVMSQFEKIKAYCDANQIQLICVTSPITPSAIQPQRLDVMHDTLTSYFASQGVAYYDFNDVRETVLPRRDADYGDMEGHMGGELGDRYSQVLANLLQDVKNGTYQESSYFYSSFDEMFANMQSEYEQTTGQSFHVAE